MYKHIAVAVDGSVTSDAALAEALKLGQENGASILLLHVCEEIPVMLDTDGMSVVYAQDVMQAIAEAGKALLKRCSGKVLDAGLAAETKLIETSGGRMGKVLVDAAQNWGAELLVLGTHGRKGIVHLLLGSVAEDVIRNANMPVLLVRAPLNEK